MRRLFSSDSFTTNSAWDSAWNTPWNSAWNTPWLTRSASSAQAATLLREGVIDPADLVPHARPHPVLGERGVARWGRWAQPVLVEMLHRELMAPLRFNVTTAPAPGTVQWLDGAAVVVDVQPRTAAEFTANLQTVLAAAQLREERAAEIAAQADAIAAAFMPLWPVAPGRLPMTMLLLDAVSALCTSAVMPVKDAFGYWRPHELSPQVQPMLEPPGHATYPAGHAVQAHAAARVLRGLWSGLPTADATRLGRLAGRVADRVGSNRVVAGLHFRLDIDAGEAMGQALADWVLGRAGLAVWTPGAPTTLALSDATAAALTTQAADTLVNAAGLTLLQQVARRAWLEWAWLWTGKALPPPAGGGGGGGGGGGTI